MDWQSITGLAIVAPIILFPAAFVWYLNIDGIYSATRSRRKAKLAERVDKTCSIDADCPEGYVCLNGRCVPSNLKI